MLKISAGGDGEVGKNQRRRKSIELQPLKPGQSRQSRRLSRIIRKGGRNGGEMKGLGAHMPNITSTAETSAPSTDNAKASSPAADKRFEPGRFHARHRAAGPRRPIPGPALRHGDKVP